MINLRKGMLSLLILLPLILSGCKIPFINKEISVPSLEKSPREIIALAYEKMNTVKSYKQVQEGSLNTQIDMALVKRQPLAFLIYNRPRVLGVKIDSGSSTVLFGNDASSGELSFDPKSFISDMLDVEIGYKLTSSYKRSNGNDYDSQSSIETNIGAMNMNFKVNAGIIRSGTSTFIKVEQLPPLLSNYFKKDYINKWILLDGAGKEWESLAQRINIPKSDDKSPEHDSAQMLSGTRSVQEKILLEIFKEEYSDIKKMEDEKINGHESFHFIITSDPKKIENFFVKALEIYRSELGEANQGIDSYLQMLKEKQGSLIAGMEKFEIDVFIDKNEFFIDRIEFDASLNLIGAMGEQAESVKSAKSVFHIKTDYSDFGSEIAIDHPKDYMLLSAIISESMKNMVTTDESMAELSDKNNDLNNISNIRMMTTALELYFNSKNEYPKQLSDLVNEDLLSKIPENANFENLPYNYQQHDGGSSYSIEYALGSDDVKYGRSGIVYCATPVGLEQICKNYKNSSLDKDNDRVIDSIEKETYKTDPTKSDTDGDGYPDGEEIISDYNPAGKGLLALNIKSEPDTGKDDSKSGFSLFGGGKDWIMDYANKGISAKNEAECKFGSAINEYCLGGFAFKNSNYGLCEKNKPSYTLISMCMECDDYFDRIGPYGNSSYEHCFLAYGAAKKDVSACSNLVTTNGDINAPDYDPKYTPLSIREESCIYGVALANDDEKICANAGFFHDTCYDFFANEKKNIGLCEQIIDEGSRNECFKDVAPISDKIDNCNKIKNIKSSGGPVYYSNMPGADKGINKETELVDECMSEYAEKHTELKEAKICDLIIGERYRSACITSIGDNAKNISICELISDSEYKNDCYRSVAPKTNNPGNCQKVGNVVSSEPAIFYYGPTEGVNEETRSSDDCLVSYVWQHKEIKDKAFCDKIVGEHFVYQCRKNVVYNIGNKDLCSIEFIGNKDIAVECLTYMPKKR